jgi:hypothetical protein
MHYSGLLEFGPYAERPQGNRRDGARLSHCGITLSLPPVITSAWISILNRNAGGALRRADSDNRPD